jgi:hypothetical protein
VVVGGGAHGHLDEGVEPALRPGAALGVGIVLVGEAEFVVDALPGSGEGGAADGVEDRLDMELVIDPPTRAGLPVPPARRRPSCLWHRWRQQRRQIDQRVQARPAQEREI